MPTEIVVSPAAPPKTSPDRPSEAFEVIHARLQRKTGRIPADLLARHILWITREADFPVQREAAEALLRRMKFADRDGLRIASRPRGSAFGLYRTRRKRSSTRPYETLLESVRPLRGSCDCPDFLRNSLALCKHLLIVLHELFRRPASLEKAPALPAPNGRVRWDPVRPLNGPGDPLDQIRGANGELHATNPSRRLQAVTNLLPSVSDPATRSLLERERDRLQDAIEAAEAARELAPVLGTMNRKLYPYQEEGVRRFLSTGRLLLADDMGLGKTAQAIAACHVLHKAGKARRILILVPAALKPQWLREWQTFTDIPARLLEGRPEERRRILEKPGVLIGNYEQLLRDLDAVLRWKPDMVVLDEAQRIKNWATKTAAYVKLLTPPYRLVLTGTPMENRLEELASIVEWVDDFALEPKWRLVPWHSRPEGGGARNLDTLRARLAPCMLRRVRKEVLDQLPPRTDTRLPVPMTPEQQEEHDALNQPIAALVGISKKRPLTQAEFLRLMMLLTTQRIICNGLAQLRFNEMWPSLAPVSRPSDTHLQGLFSPKLRELREQIAPLVLEQERKVVVFSQWRRMLRLAHWSLQDLLADGGVRAVYFTGAEDQKRRTNNLVDFHDDPACRVLFASDAGGVGLNLQHASNCCLHLDLPWNPAVLEQRIGRIYRIGQKRPIDVYYLVSEGGIEGRIANLVDDKRALFTGLFDGTSDEIRFDRSGSFLSRIERILEPVRTPRREVESDLVSAPEVEEAISAADETHDPEPVSPPDIGRLFSGVRVRKTEAGGLVLEAEPAAAATLAAMFEGMAKLLQQTAAPR